MSLQGDRYISWVNHNTVWGHNQAEDCANKKTVPNDTSGTVRKQSLTDLSPAPSGTSWPEHSSQAWCSPGSSG